MQSVFSTGSTSLSLGCYSGEHITLIARQRGNYVIAVKDGRYSVDPQLAEAISTKQRNQVNAVLDARTAVQENAVVRLRKLISRKSNPYNALVTEETGDVQITPVSKHL